jgi:hypothetical protein
VQSFFASVKQFSVKSKFVLAQDTVNLVWQNRLSDDSPHLSCHDNSRGTQLFKNQMHETLPLLSARLVLLLVHEVCLDKGYGPMAMSCQNPK